MQWVCRKSHRGAAKWQVQGRPSGYLQLPHGDVVPRGRAALEVPKTAVLSRSLAVRYAMT
jgi:hypothetical protein